MTAINQVVVVFFTDFLDEVKFYKPVIQEMSQESLREDKAP
jgi:hypothetical protein